MPSGDPSALVVEGQRAGIAFAKGEGRVGLVGVCAHAHHLSELRRPWGAGQVGEQTASLDSSELLGVADQAENGPRFGGDLSQRGQVFGAGHARLIDQKHVPRIDRDRQCVERFPGQGRVLAHPGEGQRVDGVTVGADVVGEDAGCCRGGCQTDDGSAGVVPGSGDDLHGCGLAGSGRSHACGEQCSGTDEVLCQGSLSGIEGPSLGVLVRLQRSVEIGAGSGHRDRRVGRLQGDGLGGQHCLGGELLGVGVPVHTGPARPDQRAGKVQNLRRGQLDDEFSHGGDHNLFVRPVQGLGALESVTLEQGGNGGVDVGTAELRPPCGHCLHRPLGYLPGVDLGVEQLPRHLAPTLPGDLANHAVHCVRADDLFGHLPPGGAVFGQGLGGLFGVAGVEDGLLPQGVGRPLGRLPIVLLNVLTDESVIDRPGQGPAGGEGVDQAAVDALDLPDGRLVRVRVVGLELHAHAAGQKVVQGRVVAGRDRLVHLMDRTGIQRQPTPVGSLDLVSQQHVGVQVRVPPSSVEVGELSRDDAARLNLLDAARSDPGVDRVVLGPCQGFGHGFVVQGGHLGGGLLIGQRPQDADTFHWGEREVEPGDRLLDLVAFAVDPGDDILAGGVFVAELFGVERARDPLGDLSSFVAGGAPALGVKERLFGRGDGLQDVDPAGVDGEGSAELAGRQAAAVGHHLVGVRVQALAVQSRHLCFGDDRPRDRVVRFQSVEPAPDPCAGWGALGGVVVRQGHALRVGVVSGDRAQQVLVSSTGVHRSKAHHTHQRMRTESARLCVTAHGTVTSRFPSFTRSAYCVWRFERAPASVGPGHDGGGSTGASVSDEVVGWGSGWCSRVS